MPHPSLRLGVAPDRIPVSFIEFVVSWSVNFPACINLNGKKFVIQNTLQTLNLHKNPISYNLHYKKFYAIIKLNKLGKEGNMTQYRRWYDNDPVLKEALELLSMATDDEKDEASKFLLNLQNEVAKDVIESLYDQIKDFQERGNRWYDKDPVMLKSIELLRVAPPNVQRKAAKKLLTTLYKDSGNSEEK